MNQDVRQQSQQLPSTIALEVRRRDRKRQRRRDEGRERPNDSNPPSNRQKAAEMSQQTVSFGLSVPFVNQRSPYIDQGYSMYAQCLDHVGFCLGQSSRMQFRHTHQVEAMVTGNLGSTFRVEADRETEGDQGHGTLREFQAKVEAVYTDLRNDPEKRRDYEADLKRWGEQFHGE
jgi:hypothetical protein